MPLGQLMSYESYARRSETQNGSTFRLQEWGDAQVQPGDEVDRVGFEPTASCLRSKLSSADLTAHWPSGETEAAISTFPHETILRMLSTVSPVLPRYALGSSAASISFSDRCAVTSLLAIRKFLKSSHAR